MLFFAFKIISTYLLNQFVQKNNYYQFWYMPLIYQPRVPFHFPLSFCHVTLNFCYFRLWISYMILFYNLHYKAVFRIRIDVKRIQSGSCTHNKVKNIKQYQSLHVFIIYNTYFFSCYICGLTESKYTSWQETINVFIMKWFIQKNSVL